MKKPEAGESRAVRLIKHTGAMSMRLQYGILIDKTKCKNLKQVKVVQ